MKKTSNRKLRTAALSLALTATLSGSAFAAWNPATGQTGSLPPASGSSPAAAPSPAPGSQTIVAAPLSAGSNPDATPKNDGSGSFSAPGSTGGTVGVVTGYCKSVNVAGYNQVENFYKFVVDASKSIYGELHAIYEYLAYGVAENASKAANGLIGTMIKEHDLDRKFLEEQLALNHVRMQELMMKASYANAAAGKLQDYRACDDIVANTLARSAGGGAAGRGGGSSAAKGETENKIAKTQAGGSGSQVAHASAIYKDHKDKGYCSYEDVNFYKPDGTIDTAKGTRNAFACSAPGSMPDADARAQSVFAPAHDYTKPEVVAKQTLTFDKNGSGTAQKQAADDAIRNIVSSFSPPHLTKEQESTDAGRMYLTKTKVFNARTSSAVHALAAMADRRTSSNIGSGSANTSGGSFLFFKWGKDDWKTIYARVFGFGSVADVPAQLSEADALRFEAYLRYYDDSTKDDSWYSKQVEGGSGDDLLKEQLRMGSVELMMLYNIHQRMEENNMIQAAILSHMINPVTKDELERSAHMVSRKSNQ